MEQLRKFFESRDRFARHNGIELLAVGEGTARAKMEITDHHLNGVDIVHGGAVFTLADFAFAAASNSHGRVAVAVNVSISFLKAVTSGTLFAEARAVSVGQKLGSYTITVVDGQGELVAHFQGMAYRKMEMLSSAAQNEE